VIVGTTITIGLTVTAVGYHCCTTMTPGHSGCLPPRKSMTDRQTDTECGQAHKVFFIDARAWRTPNEEQKCVFIKKNKEIVECITSPCFLKNVFGSEISGSHGSKYEDDCLLGCCAVLFQKLTNVLTASIIILMIEAVSTSESQLISTTLHGAISQKTVISMFVRICHLSCEERLEQQLCSLLNVCSINTHTQFKRKLLTGL
jgi:hypothetical protein